MSIGANIRRLRSRKGITQRELARRVGIHFVAMNYIEQGKHEPTPSNRKRIAKILGVKEERLWIEPRQ